MVTSRPVRIPRPRPAAGPASEGVAKREEEGPAKAGPPSEVRRNKGGTKRAVRLAVVYLVILVALYVGFVLYDRTIPGGTSSAAGNGVLLFSGIFVAFAAIGVVYTLHPAPRAVEVTPDHVIVVGRWGRRRRLPRLDLLTVSVVRRYAPGWLADTPVELVELWGEDTASRSYLVDPELFAGATSSLRRG